MEDNRGCPVNKLLVRSELTMKRLLLVPLVVILVTGLILGGCAKPAPAPAPAPGPAPAPAPAPAEPIKLRWVLPVPPMSIFNEGMLVPWSKMIQERTAAIGKPVELVFFYGEALTKIGEELTSLKAGITDGASNINHTHFAAGGGIISAMDLPFLFSDTMAHTQAVMDMYDKHPEFQDFYSDVKLMWFQPTGPSHAISATKKQIKTLEDFKGLRTFAMGKYDVERTKALGAVGVDISIQDVYISLERGGLDYVAKNWEAYMAFKWFEVTKYRTEVPRGLTSGCLVSIMNWDSWNKLPPDVQAIFEELNGRFMAEFAAKAMDGADIAIRGVVLGMDKGKGNPPLYEVPQEEFQRWVEATQPVYDLWIKEKEAEGLPARAIVEEVRQLGDKYSK